MAAFIVAQLTIHDLPKFLEYRDRGVPIVESFGGKVIAVSESPPDSVEADWKPQFVVVQQWPSKERFYEFYRSEEYQSVLPLRLGCSTGELVLFDSTF